MRGTVGGAPGGSAVNRKARRREASIERRLPPEHHVIKPPDRAVLLGIIAAMVEVDDTIAGFTMIAPSGDTQYIDGRMLRDGGRA